MDILGFLNFQEFEQQKQPFLMPGSNFEAQKPSKQDKKIFGNIYTNHRKSTFWVFFNFEKFTKQKQPFVMPRSNFEAQKPTTQDKKIF